MALKYKLVQKGNPSNPTAPKKFYGNAVNTGNVTLRALADEIAEISTVGHADTVAVIESLLQLIPRHVTEGKIVRLGDFGSFGVRLSTEGADSETEFNSRMIKSLRMYFRPGAEVKKVLTSTKFEKV